MINTPYGVNIVSNSQTLVQKYRDFPWSSPRLSYSTFSSFAEVSYKQPRITTRPPWKKPTPRRNLLMESMWSTFNVTTYGVYWGSTRTFFPQREREFVMRHQNPRSSLASTEGVWNNGVNTSLYRMSMPPELVALVSNNLLDKVNRKKMELGVTLLEAKKTFTYIRRRSLQLFHALRAIGRLDPRAANRILFSKGDPRGKLYRQKKRVTDTPTALWLEYRNAVMPVIYDIVGAEEYFHFERSFIYSVQSSHKFPEFIDSLKEPKIRNETFGDGTHIGETTEVNLWRGHSKMVVELPLDHVLLHSWAVELGLTTSNLGTIVWELIPLSWAVDIGFKIGSYIDRLSAMEGLLFRDGYHSYHCTTYLFSKLNSNLPDSVSANVGYRTSQTTCSTTIRYFERVMMTHPPSAVYKTSFGKMFLPRNAMSLVALFDQLLKDPKRRVDRRLYA